MLSEAHQALRTRDFAREDHCDSSVGEHSVAPRTAQELVGGDQHMLVNGLKPAIVYRRDQFNGLQHTYSYT